MASTARMAGITPVLPWSSLSHPMDFHNIRRIFFGWFRIYAAMSFEDLEWKNNDAGCCCGICGRLIQCIKSCLGRLRSRQHLLMVVEEPSESKAGSDGNKSNRRTCRGTAS